MILIGIARIGNEPTVRMTQGGQRVMTLALAYNYGKKNEAGEKPTQWIDASMWGERCEKIAPYLKKGQRIYVHIDDAHLHVSEKDGVQYYKMRGTLAQLELIEHKQTQPTQPTQPIAKPKPAAGSGFDDIDSDIPF
jgi:single-strand DNA-binding protein